MAKLKTQPHDGDVDAFLRSIENPQRRQDAFTILQLMRDITGEEPRLWGPSIVGFGTYHYKYASGREGDWFRTGFSPRKQALTLYLMGGVGDEDLWNRLGKYTTGKSCLYIKKLEDVDLDVLRKLIVKSIERLKELYGE
ncbi:MAG: DUF1801 domain-containing protein [Bacteroidetes bacterium]|nr:MAG: DUF1801 domain-containing protein [Bacteroidota bacterium]